MSKRLLARLSASWLTGFAFAAALLFTHAAPATGDGRDANRLTHWPVASISDGDTVSGKTYDELGGQDTSPPPVGCEFLFSAPLVPIRSSHTPGRHRCYPQFSGGYHLLASPPRPFRPRHPLPGPHDVLEVEGLRARWNTKVGTVGHLAMIDLNGSLRPRQVECGGLWHPRLVLAHQDSSEIPGRCGPKIGGHRRHTCVRVQNLRNINKNTGLLKLNDRDVVPESEKMCPVTEQHVKSYLVDK